MRISLLYALNLVVTFTSFWRLVLAEEQLPEVDLPEPVATNMTSIMMEDDLSASSCASNVEELYDLLAVRPESVTDILTATICPNTHIISSDLTGRSRLINPTNTFIRCGEDGTLENNCTWSSQEEVEGVVGTLVVIQMTDRQIRSNIRFSGIAFDGLSRKSWVGTFIFQGFLVFENCSFQNYIISSPGLILITPSEVETNVLLSGCLFQDNRLAGDKAEAKALIFVDAEASRVTINGTQFINNNLISQADPEQSTGIFRAVTGMERDVSVDLQNNCFSGNAVVGPLFSVSASSEVPTVSSNAVDPLTSSGCTLVEYGSSCIEADFELCELCPKLSPIKSLSIDPWAETCNIVPETSPPETSPPETSPPETSPPETSPSPTSSLDISPGLHFVLFVSFLVLAIY